MGKVGVQVKSSKGALRRHLRKRPEVLGLYVNGLSDQRAGELLLVVVGKARAAVLELRNQLP